MEAAAAGGETPRLPEELLAAIISLTSPQDALRAAAVSRAFLAAADSDTVWSGFLPRDLPRFVAEGELPPAPPSKKALFRCLSDIPALLPRELVSMRLDRATGAKCFLLSARALHIARGETTASWQWIDLRSDEIQENVRFSEAARLRKVSWLEIRGKMQCRMLSLNSAYMVFKLADSWFNKLDFPFQVASRSALEGSVQHGKFASKATWRLGMMGCLANILGGLTGRKRGGLASAVALLAQFISQTTLCSLGEGLTAGWRSSWVSSTTRKAAMVRCVSA